MQKIRHPALVILLAIVSVLPIYAQNRGVPATPKMVTLRHGHFLELQLLTPLDSGSAKIGDEISFQVFSPVTVGGQTVIPEGWSIHARIDNVRRARKNCKNGSITWTFEQTTPKGARISLQTGVDIGPKARHLVARVAKEIELVPVVVVLSPILIPLIIAMHAEGCAGAYGKEQTLMAGAILLARVAHDVRLPVIR